MAFLKWIRYFVFRMIKGILGFVLIFSFFHLAEASDIESVFAHKDKPWESKENSEAYRIEYCKIAYKDTLMLTVGLNWVTAVYSDENFVQSVYSAKKVDTESLYKVFGLQLSSKFRADGHPASITLQILKNFGSGTLVLNGYYYELYDCHVFYDRTNKPE